MDWDEHVAYLRETFINQMVARKFRLNHDASVGAKTDATLTGPDTTITLSDGFPYAPPKVRATKQTEHSWHREPNGTLCLYSPRDGERQPWLDVDDFLARVDLWFDKNDAGWPNDPPALDFEAYLDMPVDARLVIYGDKAKHSGEYIRLRGDQRLLRVVGGGMLPRKSTKGYVSGFVADLGQHTRPLSNWSEIAPRLTDSEAICSAIERGRIEVLLVRYRRQDQHGVLALTFTSENTKRDNTKGMMVRRALSASEDRFTISLRAGTTTESVKDKHVYVLGAGAVGSHICDGLSRAGVGELTIRDGDYLLPGNTPRHVVAEVAAYGKHKPEALRAVLESRVYNRTAIHDINTNLKDPSDAVDLFKAGDLLVDATADGAVTAMLTDAALATGNRFISVCIQNEGRTHRLDIVPPLNGADPLPATARRAPQGPEVFEAGCGEPVSMTPPDAVAETAAMAVRHILSYLAGAPLASAGECREL